MATLSLPSEPTNELKLADWLEVLALLSEDGNSSSGDLASALSLSSVFEGGRNEGVEQKCLEVFSELEDRQNAADSAYPFEINGSVLQLKENRDHFSAYIFCLCLSYFQWSTKRSSEIDINPWLLFEELAAISARKYIGGDVLRFGTSRSEGKKDPSMFRDAVNRLCRQFGEGIGFKEQDTLDVKDDKVDLVAWKHFQDRRPGKIVMFGQCAAGGNWTSKISELNPNAFWGQWVQDSGAISPFIRSFYIPHRVPRSKWDHKARYAGVLFDRCRIAYWTVGETESIRNDLRYKQWYEYILNTPTPPAKSRKATRTVRRAKPTKKTKPAKRSHLKQ
jgi:hypothetical protein